MKRIISRKMMLAGFGFLAILTQGCAKISFSPQQEATPLNLAATELPSPHSTGDSAIPATGATPVSEMTCLGNPQSVEAPTKILFLVDISASNAIPDYTSPATDPNKTLRGGAIQKFFNQYASDRNISWGLEVFGNDTATSLLGENANPKFSASSEEMQRALNQFFNLQDFGSTPYRAALKLAQRTLSLDTQNSALNTQYLVVFISDGVPDPYVADNTLRGDIDSLINLAPGRIRLSTVYYGPTSLDAHQRLEMMASKGGGRFLDTNSQAQELNLDNIITIPDSQCSP